MNRKTRIDTAVLQMGQREERLPRNERIKSMLTRFRIGPGLAVLAIVWAFFTILNPLFLSPGNISNLLLQIAAMATLAIGLVFILLIGEIDLSVAALSGVGGAIAGWAVVIAGWNVTLAIFVSLAVGVGWSLIQGLIVLYGAPSFIVTLAGSLALGGVLLMILPESGQISLASSELRYIAGSYLPTWIGWIAAVIGIAITSFFFVSKHRARAAAGLDTNVVKGLVLPIAVTAVAILAVALILNSHRGIPVVFAILITILGILSYISTQTRFGVNVYAVGGNREAARRAGIPVNGVILWCFGLAGLFASVGGIFAASRLLGVSNQSGGGSLLLEAIAAAVIGGTSLFGGRGTVWSALLGALLIGSISNGMDLLGLPTEAKLVVTGAVLVLATISDVVISRGSFSWRKN